MGVTEQGGGREGMRGVMGVLRGMQMCGICLWRRSGIGRHGSRDAGATEGFSLYAPSLRSCLASFGSAHSLTGLSGTGGAMSPL